MSGFRKTALLLCTITIWGVGHETIHAGERSNKPSTQLLSGKKYAVAVTYITGQPIFLDRWEFQPSEIVVGNKIAEGTWSTGGAIIGANWNAEFLVPDGPFNNQWRVNGLEGFGLLVGFGIADPIFSPQAFLVFGFRVP